jgi:Uma2 family endonuclease
VTVALQKQHSIDDEFVDLDGVSWETYEALLRDLENSHQFKRITYDQGRMVIVSPLPKHEIWKSLLGRFVETIADARDIPISTFGSTTWKRRDRQRGLEPDECFYIQHESKVRGKLSFNPRRDPPPDLAIEIEIRRMPIDRMAVYAALGIPEIWRFNGKRIQAFLLQRDRSYKNAEMGRAFPFLKPADLKQFLDMFGKTDQNSILREVRQWARKLPS